MQRAWCLVVSAPRRHLGIYLALGSVVACACGSADADEAVCDDGRAASALTRRCFNHELDADEGGRVACVVYRAFPSSYAACACDQLGHRPATPPPWAVERLHRTGQCEGDPCCENHCFCELDQLSGDDLQTCQNDPSPQPEPVGFCYVDPGRGVGSEAVVEMCPLREKRLLRFLGLGSQARLVFGCNGGRP